VLGRIGSIVGQEWFGQPWTNVLLTPDPGGSEVVDGQASHDRGQIRLGGLDHFPRCDRPVVPQLGLLHEVLRLGHAPDHPVGDREQKRPELVVILAPLGPTGHGPHPMKTRQQLPS
jgi:hypothetical protein